MELWFARHAESLWNARGLWQGQADPELSERGREQAATMARALAALDERPVAVASSDLRRARETGEVVARHLALPLEIEPGLRERDVGAWSGLPHGEIGRRFAADLARLRAGDPDVRPGGGESRREFAARVGAALAGLARRSRGHIVLVVSHLGVLRLLSPGARLENARWLRLGTAPPGEAPYALDSAPPRGGAPQPQAGAERDDAY